MSNPVQRNDLSIYDAEADGWWDADTRWVRTLHNMVPARLRYFDTLVDWEDRDVLDLGCAGGFMAEALARRNARVTGIDPATKAIDAARRHADHEGLSIRYDVGTGEMLPYGSESFDRVVCVDVLEHVDDLGKVLAQVARVLRPGGYFLFDTINRNLLSRLAVVTMAEDILRLLPRGTHDPAKFIRPGELKSALTKAGLTCGAMAGLGPSGINSKGDLTFGRHPGTLIVYMGTAEKAAAT
ncbi:MAG: bifunctional 2-polyprenyl-6-hydroxyphenol methylase/3-demethylubiquinol 3-O-methyltransferase UbiG [Pseudomonadota bacterium]